MKADERKKTIIALLLASKDPLSGGDLAKELDISRQTLVQDIRILRERGYEILSTNQGYLLQEAPFCQRVFKVRHSSEQTEDELSCIVSLGGTVVDVYVWHKVYGKIVAPLNIFSPLQIKHFMEGVRSGQSKELMQITGGYHYHTVRAESEELLDRIEEALTKKHYIVPESGYESGQFFDR